MAEFKAVMEDLERKRTLLTLIEQLGKTVSDSMLADSAFHDALDFYNYVKRRGPAAGERRRTGVRPAKALL